MIGPCKHHSLTPEVDQEILEIAKWLGAFTFDELAIECLRMRLAYEAAHWLGYALREGIIERCPAETRPRSYRVVCV